MKLGNTRLVEHSCRRFEYAFLYASRILSLCSTKYFKLINCYSHTLMKCSSLFQVGEGWTNLGQATLPTDGQSQFDIYMLNNPTLPAYTSLNLCATNSSK